MKTTMSNSVAMSSFGVMYRFAFSGDKELDFSVSVDGKVTSSLQLSPTYAKELVCALRDVIESNPNDDDRCGARLVMPTEAGNDIEVVMYNDGDAIIFKLAYVGSDEDECTSNGIVALYPGTVHKLIESYFQG